ncbi:hypothetical protein [Tritonibacter mobilis]|uniref:hypothetical protein n=1 Tax=Tritonibacter mobilis TaxID=379347 RepID=UPI00080689BE|nr:hypothetical protein [Tritonibacter mobilis]SDX85020.1 hypothetical protein SAMN05444385_11511 [Tritonibacter mobilis]
MTRLMATKRIQFGELGFVVVSKPALSNALLRCAPISIQDTLSNLIMAKGFKLVQEVTAHIEIQTHKNLGKQPKPLKAHEGSSQGNYGWTRGQVKSDNEETYWKTGASVSLSNRARTS